MNGILYTQNLNKDIKLLTGILRKIEIDSLYYPKGIFTIEDLQALQNATHIDLLEIPEGTNILHSIINECDFVLYSKELKGRDAIGKEIVSIAFKSNAPCIQF